MAGPRVSGDRLTLVWSMAEIFANETEISAGAGLQLIDGDALIFGMPLVDVSGPPHGGLSALGAEVAGVQSAMTVEGRRRRQLYIFATEPDCARQRPLRRQLGGMHERTKLGFDRPGLADIGGSRHRGEHSLRIVSRQKPPIEHQAHLVLHRMGCLRP